MLDSFSSPIRFAAGYGSAVFSQKGYALVKGGGARAPMVDLIFGVTHPEHWHSLNIRQNPGHYSFLKRFGSRTIATLQEKFGAGVYFNPEVTVKGPGGEGVRIKYGVVSMERLIKDLREWDTLYLAGRMQKPVKILRGDARVKMANNANLENATRIALLSLPMEFSEEDFFKLIVGISYTGDFRMAVGENPRKIHNIVAAQFHELRALYKPVIDNLPNITTSTAQWAASASLADAMTLTQDEDVKLRSSLLLNLPKGVQDYIIREYQKTPAAVTTGGKS
ncbi:Mitochondrial translocator assembly and maintenance protein 41 [Irineochytrium annulatum]|nr:Mitochondrial translocator assembly and maintenance protein 41 [Irineochytrium annulatum]